MLHKIRNHALLAMVFLTLSLAQQYAFFAIKGHPILWLSLSKYLGYFLIFVIFSFIPSKKIRFIYLSFLILLNLPQMAHLSYFGTQILPSEILLLFAEMHEISAVLGNELQHVLIPVLLTIIPLAIGWLTLKKFPTTYHFKAIPLLITVYFLYNPVRTFITGNTWGRQPSTSELAGMNMYLSLSYFMGRILPAKLESKRYSQEENNSLKLSLVRKEKSQWDHIIVVLGESQSPDQMSLFNYARPTTPFLESLKENTNFHYLKGLSSGVSTDISVAFFLNMGYGDAGALKAAKGQHCHFKLAKENGFSTHFLSTQSNQQLRYIAPYLCSAYLDDLRSLEKVSPETLDHNAAIDRHLLPRLEELLETKGNKFIMLHQRGSHGPWPLRFTEESKLFTDNRVDQRINDYDNSVVEFDLFWKELHSLISKRKEKILVLYLSDHGEGVGKNNLWGHGQLRPGAFEIPIFILAFNQNLPKKTKDLQSYLPQYNFSLFLANQVGYETNQNAYEPMKDFTIYGNDIDGFAGKAEIKFDENKQYTFNVIP